MCKAGVYAVMKRARLELGAHAIMAINADAIEPVRIWRNAQMSILRQMQPIDAEAQEAYFESVIWPDKESPEPANVLVGFYEDERLVGYGGLVHIAWAHRRAEVSCLLDPVIAAQDERRDQLTFALISLIKELAFQDLGLLRLTTETYETRKCVIPVLERAGFRLEGVLRRHIIKDGVTYDTFVHGLLSSD
jgi:RimJ/RimL family protein N-acetyltransferase